MHFDATFRIIKLKFETVACICQEQLYNFLCQNRLPFMLRWKLLPVFFNYLNPKGWAKETYIEVTPYKLKSVAIVASFYKPKCASTSRDPPPQPLHKYMCMCISLSVSITTRAPRGTDRSPEYNEHFCYKLDSRVKNYTTEWNQKQQHFITQASRSLVWIRFVAVAFRSEEVFWRRGPTPLSLDPPLGLYIFMHVPGHEHFIPTKFHKHPLSSSAVKAG